MNPLLLSLIAAAQAQAPMRPDREGTFWLPPAASTLADDIDAVWAYIYWVDVIFVLVLALTMLLFFVKYRQRRGDEKTADIKGNHTLEFAWSVFPGFLLIGMFYTGFKTYMDSVVPPADSLEISVVGQKWSWQFTHDCPSGDKQFVDSELRVPKGQPVKLLMSSKDVLHSFFVPDFRVKKDVLPNRYTVLWFEAPWEGKHQVYCTEYCGDGHSRMLNTVHVLDPQDYRLYQQENCEGALDPVTNPIAAGEKLFQTKACAGCHSLDGSALVGPTMKGKFGTQEKLADGSSVLVDENYLRDSIMVPGAQVVAGFQPVMPSFQGQLSDDETNALIAYIKTLK